MSDTLTFMEVAASLSYAERLIEIGRLHSELGALRYVMSQHVQIETDQANELTACQEQLRAASTRIDQFQFCINKIAEALNGVACGGVDSSPAEQMADSHSTTRVLCDAIASLKGSEGAIAMVQAKELYNQLQSANEQLAHCNREREAAEAYAAKWQAIVEGAEAELPEEPQTTHYAPDSNNAAAQWHYWYRSIDYDKLRTFVIAQVAGRKAAEKLLRRVIGKMRDDAGTDDPMEPFAFDAEWEELVKECDAALAAEGEKK